MIGEELIASFRHLLIHFPQDSLALTECKTLLYGISANVLGDVHFESSTLFFSIFAYILHLSVHAPTKSSNILNLGVFITYRDKINNQGHCLHYINSLDESNLRDHQKSQFKLLLVLNQNLRLVVQLGCIK